MIDLIAPEKVVQTPRNLAAGSRKLWDAATDEFDWADHELAVLEQACRTLDRIVQLDRAVSEGGLMLASSQGFAGASCGRRGPPAASCPYPSARVVGDPGADRGRGR